MKRRMVGSFPSPLDFERASLTWVTRDNSHGRWRVIASCCSSHAGRPERFVLSPRIMAGDVYGTGKLPRDPPYGFQIIASTDRHVIIRDFESDLPGRNTANSNFQIFSSLAIEAPLLFDEARINPASLDGEPLRQAWPLTARLHVSKDGVDHVSDFPVHHLNTKARAFQIETGPVLVPATLIGDPALTVDGFALAFVFFNRLDQIDLAIRGPVKPGSMRQAYVHFARWEGISIELYKANRAPRLSQSR